MDGCSYDVDGLTILNLKGTWHQMGMQYGILAKEQMTDVLAYIDKRLGADNERTKAAAEIADSLYAKYPDHLKDFFDGVERGDISTEKGLMISTNHYVNDGWPFARPTDETSWNSITRRNNLRRKAEEYKGRIGVEKMKEIISTSMEDGGPMHYLTRYQIVAVPEDMTLHIHIPSSGKWVELKMSEYF